jgi:cobalt-zinc-cadmium efflux system protein
MLPWLRPSRWPQTDIHLLPHGKLGRMASSHDHGHGHAHDGHHGHAHGDPQQAGRAFALAIGLNAVFVAVEFGYGLVANSTALLADAGHNLSDVLGLFLAWGAAVLSRRPPSERFTFGLRGSSILAALANGTLLFVACGGIGWEAVRRFGSPPAVATDVVMAVAAVGIVVNGVSAWLFASGSRHDMNLRGAFLHLAADAAVSLGVVVGGLVMRQTGWYWVDPVLSLVIVLVILASTWGLLRASLNLALAAVPPHVDSAAVRSHLQALPGVTDVHDLHIWALSTTESALTVHLVMPDGAPGDAFIDEVTAALESRFSIHHSTLQIERGETTHACRLHANNRPAEAHHDHDDGHDHDHPHGHAHHPHQHR